MRRAEDSTPRARRAGRASRHVVGPREGRHRAIHVGGRGGKSPSACRVQRDLGPRATRTEDLAAVGRSSRRVVVRATGARKNTSRTAARVGGSVRERSTPEAGRVGRSSGPTFLAAPARSAAAARGRRHPPRASSGVAPPAGTPSAPGEREVGVAPGEQWVPMHQRCRAAGHGVAAGTPGSPLVASGTAYADVAVRR